MAYSRHLGFFDETVVADSLSGGTFSVLSGVRATCTTSGRGFLWLGTSTGDLYRIDCAQQVTSFKAHESSVQHVHQFRQHDLLLSIGSDTEDQGVGEQVKIWNLSKWTGKQTTPFCCRTLPTLSSGQGSNPVTCLAADESLQFLVLGHQSGLLQLLKGDLSRSRQCKRTVLHTFSSALLGVGLYNPAASQLSNHLPPADSKSCAAAVEVGVPATGSSSSSLPPGPLVYATSSHTMMSFLLQPRRLEEIQSKAVLDSFNAPLGCTCMFFDALGNPRFAVAYKDAIYFYNWDGRGPCLATEGNKLIVGMFKHYLVIVKGQAQTGAVGSLCKAESSSCTIVIHDLQNRFIAGEFVMPRGVLAVFFNADYICVLTGLSGSAGEEIDAEAGRALVCLSEKSIPDKLDLLFSKKNFQTAIEIAKSQRYTVEQLGSIYAHYADHLYGNKEYDAAVQEYKKTIGTLEASFVIQRFLEGGHISQLTDYLEALTRSSSVTTRDHWTLLLSCYSRLQDKVRIDQLVKREPLPDALDVEAAIHVLRQSEFFSMALELATRCQRFSECVDILIDDLGDAKGALKQIKGYPFDEALKAVCNHGTLLVEALPVETLKLLEQLCNHKGSSQINVQHLLKIFVNNREELMHFLEHYLKSNLTTWQDSGIVDTLLELTVQMAMAPTDSKAGQKRLGEAALRLLRNEQLPYDSTKALLVCHQRGFIEGCLFLWETLKMYDQLLEHYMTAESVDDVLVTCHKFGDATPRLWLQALNFFSRRPDCPAQLQVVISIIDRNSLASPLSVLEALSAAGPEHSCSVATVRDYFLNRLEGGNARIESMRSQLQRLREETMRNREVVRKLNTQIKVFQQVNCQICQHSLRPPSVHFLCDHSYHKLCFETYSNAQQCPECANKNSKLLASVATWTNSPSASLITTDASSNNTFIRDLEYALQEARKTSGELSSQVPPPLLSHVVSGFIASQPMPVSLPVFGDGDGSVASDLPPVVATKVGLPHQMSPSRPSPASARLATTGSVTGSSPARVESSSRSEGYFSGSSRTTDLGVAPPRSASKGNRVLDRPRIRLNPFDDDEEEKEVLGDGGGRAVDSGVDCLPSEPKNSLYPLD